MRYCLLTLLLFVFSSLDTSAQLALQDFTGLVVDKETQQPVTSVDIRLLQTTKRFQIATDSRGYFQIRNIPVGVYDVFIRYMGYKTRTIRGVRLQTGETPFVWIELEQQVDKPDYIEVREFKRSSPSSKMSYGSVEAIDSETNRRWAGGFADQTGGLSFVPGVLMLDDMSNAYSVNGAPDWMNSERVDCIAVAKLSGNPGITTNKYSSLVNSYGFAESDVFMGASAISSHQLSLGGMPELKLKPGNFRSHQGAVELNLFGAQVDANGPLHGRRSLSRASYRVSASHRDYGLGILPEKSMKSNYPTTSNASLQVTVPTKHHGTVRLYGITSQSDITHNSSINEDDFAYNQFLNGTQKGSKAAFGLSHFVSLDKGKMNFTTRIGYSFDALESSLDSIPYQGYSSQYYSDNRQELFDFSADMMYKFDEKSLLNFGFETLFNKSSYNDWLYYDTVELQKEISRYAIPLRNLAEYTFYSAYQLKYSNSLKLNLGLRYNFYEHTRAKAFLPSIGFCYDFSPKTSFSIQYARKGQLPPATLLYAQSIDENTQEEMLLNQDLGYIGSNQVDVTMQFNVGRTIYGKVTAFYHGYSSVPVVNDTTSYYSYFNFGREVYSESPMLHFVDEGSARSFGTRFVFEKSIANGFYFLSNGSFVKSWYTTRNGAEFSSAWNSGFSTQGLVGYSFPLGKKVAADFNLRFTHNGGPNLRSINELESAANGYTTYDREIDYDIKRDNYQRLDMHFSILWNMRKISHEFIWDCRNLLDRANLKGQYYSPSDDEVKNIYHVNRFSMFSYRVCF